MPRKRGRSRASAGQRGLLFIGLAIAIVAAAFWLSRPKEMAFIEFGPSPVPTASVDGAHLMSGAPMAPANAPADLTVRIDMGGFTPPDLQVRSGRAQRLLIVNPDSSHHTDGGGVHGFTVPGLGVDVRVPPLTNMVITLPAAEPGEYAFYCDTCCGGKENPSMQGFVRVRA